MREVSKLIDTWTGSKRSENGYNSEDQLIHDDCSNGDGTLSGRPSRPEYSTCHHLLSWTYSGSPSPVLFIQHLPLRGDPVGNSGFGPDPDQSSKMVRNLVLGPDILMGWEHIACDMTTEINGSSGW